MVIKVNVSDKKNGVSCPLFKEDGVLLEILVYMLVSVIKSVSSMNNEYLENCTCIKHVFDTLVLTCNKTLNISKTVLISDR